MWRGFRGWHWAYQAATAAAVLVAAMVVLGLAVGGGDEPQKAAQTPRLVVVAKRSYCKPGGGEVVFYLTVRNAGSAAGSADLTPVRRYDDGSKNQSTVDTLTTPSLEPGTQRQFFHTYAYDASEHSVVGCAVIVDADAARPVALRVRR